MIILIPYINLLNLSWRIKCLFLKTGAFNALRKRAYSNTMKISPPKTENFHIKNSDIFLISAQNIDCGDSLEPPR